jgi:hypothetical protein
MDGAGMGVESYPFLDERRWIFCGRSASFAKSIAKDSNSALAFCERQGIDFRHVFRLRKTIGFCETWWPNDMETRWFTVTPEIRAEIESGFAALFRWIDAQ